MNIVSRFGTIMMKEYEVCENKMSLGKGDMDTKELEVEKL